MPSSPADHDPTLEDLAERLCGEAVLALERCAGGANNQVYRVRTRSGTFALKSYASSDVDQRDRLGHEFDGLRFLQTHEAGAALPAALAVDRDARCALYEWIEGPKPTEHGAAEIAQALALLAALHRARTAAGAERLPVATEAVLRFADLLDQIDVRRARLASVAPAQPELRSFLEDALSPDLERRVAALTGWDLAAPLEPAHRTLSPSDFGFHNALLRSDGSLAFIDFEYFGWDDPVKLTADFLWHPGMQLSAAERRQFVAGAAELYGGDPRFERRLAVAFPLYGIRWSLIALNEFLPQLWTRRAFAGKGGDWEAAKGQQLCKARALLEAVRSYHEGQFA